LSLIYSLIFDRFRNAPVPVAPNLQRRSNFCAMNPALTLCCAICLLGQTAGVGQAPTTAIVVPPEKENPTNAAGWTLFSHPTVGFELPIPPGIKLSGKSADGTGAKFSAQDQTFTVSTTGAVISGSPLWVMESNWKQALKLPGRSITSQRKDEVSFTVSGFDRNGTEFFQKFIIDGNKVATFTLTYPHARRREFDPWVTAMQKRFRIIPPPPASVRPAGSDSPDPTPMVDLTPPSKRPETQTAGDTVALNAAQKPEQETKETPPKEARLPWGVPVEGKAGLVYSPYGSKQIVDVSGLSPGIKVRCPYTGKIFRVP
jgi:hypothetical protein